MKNLSKVSIEKKATVKKIDLLQLSESIKNNVKKARSEKDAMYIFNESEINKAQIKLDSFIEKYKGKELSKIEKRNLKLSKHLSSTRSKIRNSFEGMILNYFEVLKNNSLTKDEKSKLAKITFTEFFESRFVKFKKDKDIYSDIFCNENNSLLKKINEICIIYNNK
tara:strand:- start:305 stop:802 length:498 start_codon:yes stop_codon:yes gene_type:complete